jgi:hypothetical protein
VKVPVATARGQGLRASDFCWTVEGEPVMPAMTCDSDRDDIDGGCGCQRAMSGLASSKSTTTFTVADLDLGLDEYTEAIADSLDRAGWEMPAGTARKLALKLLETVAGHLVGDVFERRGDELNVRLAAGQDE